MNSLINAQSSQGCRFYPIDFVRLVLERYAFPIKNVFLALENVQLAQAFAFDLQLWLTIDNEVTGSLLRRSSLSFCPHSFPQSPATRRGTVFNTPIALYSRLPRLDSRSQNPANVADKRLPFSNRLIHSVPRSV